MLSKKLIVSLSIYIYIYTYLLGFYLLGKTYQINTITNNFVSTSSLTSLLIFDCFFLTCNLTLKLMFTKHIYLQ